MKNRRDRKEVLADYDGWREKRVISTIYGWQRDFLRVGNYQFFFIKGSLCVLPQRRVYRGGDMLLITRRPVHLPEQRWVFAPFPILVARIEDTMRVH
jgi:hypothetical protein